jgi:DNA repair protein RecO (recombination protein O)
VRPSGESNREAWFLSAEEGIFKATVFGGPKSRLRSQVSPFHQGTLWIYHDPVRDSRKVTDFDVEIWRPALRELYERTMAADALAETVLATHGGGGAWNTALDMAAKTLDCLESGDEKNCARILLHFFWAWTDFLGIRPDLSRCHSCACEIPFDKLVWYDQAEGSVFCGNCISGYRAALDYKIARNLPLDPGPRRWLLAIGGIEPGESLRYTLDAASLRQAGTLILGILTGAIGKRLSLWDACF